MSTAGGQMSGRVGKPRPTVRWACTSCTWAARRSPGLQACPSCRKKTITKVDEAQEPR